MASLSSFWSYRTGINNASMAKEDHTALCEVLYVANSWKIDTGHITPVRLRHISKMPLRGLAERLPHTRMTRDWTDSHDSNPSPSNAADRIDRQHDNEEHE
eukprot:scaffold1004_cov105-Cylindrotheca_fusiformis.AAC.7